MEKKERDNKHKAECPNKKPGNHAKCTCGEARSYIVAPKPKVTKEPVESTSALTGSQAMALPAPHAPSLVPPTQLSLPLDKSLLRREPCVLGNVANDPEIARQWPSSEVLGRRWTPAVRRLCKLLDVFPDDTKDQQYHVRAAAVGEALLQPNDFAAPCTDAIVKAHKLNSHSAFSLTAVENITTSHQHVLGVLNLLFGESAHKEWRFWPPALMQAEGTSVDLKAAAASYTKERPNDNCICRSQRHGDLIYVPPGWWHSVETVHGSLKGDRSTQLASSWVTWVLPWELVEDVALGMLLGDVKEAQTSIRPCTLELSARLRTQLGAHFTPVS